MKCPLCHNPAMVKYNNHPSYIKNQFYEIIYCNNCNTSFVNTGKINEDIYNQIYNNPLQMPGYDRYAKLTDQIIKQTDPLKYLMNHSIEYSFIINEIKKSYNKGDRILEVGCGYGYLTWALNISGFETVGTDIADNAIDKATFIFGNYFVKGGVDSILNQTIKYNFIILTEVIEHIQEPIIFLREIKSILNSNGVILLTTPNKSAFNKTALWVTDAPPVHLWWFSEKSFHYIAQNLYMRFKIVKPRAFQKNAYYYLKRTDQIENPLFVPNGELKNNYSEILMKDDENADNKIRSSFLDLLRNITSIMPCRKVLIMIRNMLMKNHKSEIPYTLCVKLFVKLIIFIMLYSN